jgi:hypothetical protein
MVIMRKEAQKRGYVPAEIETAARPAPATLKAIHRVLFGLGGLYNKNIHKQGRRNKALLRTMKPGTWL